MEWYEIVISILTGMATAIPLVVQLVKYVRKAVKEKNWSNLMRLVMDLMATAENKFDNGSDRKAWVLSMIQSSAKTINYDIDLNEIGEMIDNLCKMAKKVNVEPELKAE